MSATQTQMAPSKPAAAAAAAAKEEPEIPQLTYAIAQTAQEKRDALRLVADTIAQQRQVASSTMIFHPAVLGPFAALLAGVAYQGRSDWAGTVILVSGIIVAYLAAIQYYTYGYVQRAENFNWHSFITPATDKPAQQEDTVMYARYADHIIATLVLRLDKAKNPHKTAASQQQRGNGSTAQVRAWATRLRYRGTGVGGDMLRNAVGLARSSLGPAVVVEFSHPHAHTVDTTKYFTAPFARREKRARQALAQAIKDVDAAANQ
ncbi:acetyltransferase, GNAT family [Cordyceps militaris CM01]|uniref:Acetyltransferase, GNAT family n=2 Tax=Cordyceps militaris TaxID=73501 RepID=G3J6G1_CORMM|nr:acetyltransferase, GNAT family [Cordyceps militaris CM01]ATY62168.1 GNAT family [Cordyceps militaris]EGX96195.1 acetyltransferase, GNAT family [Cordyceps militaris CM01]